MRTKVSRLSVNVLPLCAVHKPSNSRDKITVRRFFGAKAVALLLTGYWDLLESGRFSDMVTFSVMTQILYCLFYFL